MIYIAGIRVDDWQIIGVFTDMASAQARVVESQTNSHPENHLHKIEEWEFGAYEPLTVVEI